MFRGQEQTSINLLKQVSSPLLHIWILFSSMIVNILALHIEWCEACVQAHQWQEECLLLHEEMHRVVVFFKWQAEDWKWIAEDHANELLTSLETNELALVAADLVAQNCIYIRKVAYANLQVTMFLGENEISLQ